MRYNLLLDTDSYKPSHWLQYPPEVTGMQSHILARHGDVLWFGLQYILKKYLSQTFTQEDIDEAETFLKAHGEPFNREGWEYMLKTYRGQLPLYIRAQAEGSLVKQGEVCCTIECHDPKCFWVVSYMETMLLRVWYPCSVATVSFETKKIIKRHMEETCDDLSGLPFKLHDFGARGVSSYESSAIGGMSHLVNFMGSDTLAGVRAANHFYDCDMAAFSIPASEHSTITAWGKQREFEAYCNMVHQYAKPGKMFACVSDSYNLDHAIAMWCGMWSRVQTSGAILVIRPDSGDAVENVRHTVYALSKTYGSVKNSKGYHVLEGVRVIQGDGTDQLSISTILNVLQMHGFSAENVAFGMGGGLLQKVNRDTYGFSMKCNAVKIHDKEWIGVSKESPGKVSRAGYIHLPGSVVFCDGHINGPVTLEQVRARAEAELSVACAVAEKLGAP